MMAPRNTRRRLGHREARNLGKGHGQRQAGRHDCWLWHALTQVASPFPVSQGLVAQHGYDVLELLLLHILATDALDNHASSHTSARGLADGFITDEERPAHRHDQ